MNFLKALAEMQKGNKVRRMTFGKNVYWCIVDKEIVGNKLAEHFEADDWEVFEEDKEWNLADNMDKTHEGIATPLDVEKLRELKEKINQLLHARKINLITDEGLSNGIDAYFKELGL